MSFSVVNKIFILQFLLFSVLLFGIACVHVLSVSPSPDELNVPYVPYVVVDKNKDDFDSERLQDTIVKYLENRSQRQSYYPEASTSLYDYLKSSTSVSVTDDHDRHRDHVYDRQSNADQNHSYVHANEYEPPQHQQPAVPQTTNSRTLAQNVYQQSPQQPTADTRSMNVYPFGISDIHPGYYSSVYKPAAKIKDSSQVTANIRVTTFQPHRHLTTPFYPLYNANVSSRYRPATFGAPSSVLETVTPKLCR